jgi:hypothetical protein
VQGIVAVCNIKLQCVDHKFSKYSVMDKHTKYIYIFVLLICCFSILNSFCGCKEGPSPEEGRAIERGDRLHVGC